MPFSLSSSMIHAVFLEVDSALCVYGGCRSVSRSLSLSVSLSHQVVFFKVELQDGVFDSCKDEADVLRVSGACEMGVDDLVTVWVQVHKHLQDELSACLGVSLGTWKKNITLCSALTESNISVIEPVLFIYPIYFFIFSISQFLLKYDFVNQNYWELIFSHFKWISVWIVV